MENKKKNGKEKVVAEKGHAEKEAIKKLMNETMSKFDALATDVNKVPRKKYTGWKFGSKLLVTIGPRNLSFRMWIYEYNKAGALLSIKPFEIKSTSKDVTMVIAGLVKQVKKNHEILTAAKTKKKETQSVKETKKKEKI